MSTVSPSLKIAIVCAELVTIFFRLVNEIRSARTCSKLSCMSWIERRSNLTTKAEMLGKAAALVLRLIKRKSKEGAQKFILK